MMAILIHRHEWRGNKCRFCHQAKDAAWRYLDDEEEHEQLMNSGPAPIFGLDYRLDENGDILVPVDEDRDYERRHDK